jgi:microsomal dipeptidase-like Zn-dependent dipeptidase
MTPAAAVAAANKAARQALDRAEAAEAGLAEALALIEHTVDLLACEGHVVLGSDHPLHTVPARLRALLPKVRP